MGRSANHHENTVTTSSWDLINRIDQIINTPHTWIQKLEAIAETILSSSECDLVWILTLSPLPTAASGVLRTPPHVPSDTIALSDSFPSFPENWPAEDSVLGQALRTGLPVFTSNVAAEKYNLGYDLGNLLYNPSEINIQAVVPLLLSHTACGVIVTGICQNKKPITPLQKETLEYIAKHLALTLHNVSLAQTAQHQAKQLTMLNKIARTITSSLNFDEVLRRTIASIDDILDVEAGSLLLIDPLTQELYFKLILRGAENVINTRRLKPGEGIVGWVVENQQPVLVNNVSRDPRFTPRIDQATGFVTRSALCCPVIVKGKPIGVLEVLNKRQGGFTEADQELLMSIAASLGIALQNSQFYQQLYKEVKNIEDINRLTAAINATHSFAETAQAAVIELGNFFDFEIVIIGFLDDTRAMVHNTVLDKQGVLLNKMAPIPIGQSALKYISAKETNCVIFDLVKAHPFKEYGWLVNRNLKSLLSIRLRSDTEIVGLLSLANQDIGVYGERHFKRADQISATLSIALEKAHLLDAMRQQASELEDLNLLGEKLLARTDPEGILKTTLDTIPKMLPADVHGLIITLPGLTQLGIRLPQNASEAMINQVHQEMLEALNDSHPELQNLALEKPYIIYKNDPVPENWQPLSRLVWPILTLHGSLGVVYLAYGYQSAITADLMRLFSLVVSRISGAIENARLITEIEQEHAQLVSILSSTPDGILVIDQSGKIILDNPAAYTIFDHTSSQIGKQLAETIDSQDLLDLFQTAKTSGGAAGEFYSLTDTVYYASVSPVSVGKDTIGWVAVMQDMTHFKELDEAKDSFVSAVSHDLRSPLSSIAIASHLLKLTGEVNEQQEELLETIDVHIKQMTALIDDLLDVGKIEANIDMEMVPYSIDTLVIAAVAQLATLAAQKQIDLQLDLADHTYPKANCNPDRLQQAMTNLVSNAIKYTPEEGQVIVKLFTQNSNLLFQVIDTGVGISQNDQPHIFDKFYRSEGEHMIGKQGSGLGLAITRSIIDKHGGKVWVDSKWQKGSTFTIILPVSS